MLVLQKKLRGSLDQRPFRTRIGGCEMGFANLGRTHSHKDSKTRRKGSGKMAPLTRTERVRGRLHTVPPVVPSLTNHASTNGLRSSRAGFAMLDDGLVIPLRL